MRVHVRAISPLKMTHLWIFRSSGVISLTSLPKWIPAPHIYLPAYSSSSRWPGNGEGGAANTVDSLLLFSYTAPSSGFLLLLFVALVDFQRGGRSSRWLISQTNEVCVFVGLTCNLLPRQIQRRSRCRVRELNTNTVCVKYWIFCGVLYGGTVSLEGIL